MRPRGGERAAEKKAGGRAGGAAGKAAAAAKVGAAVKAGAGAKTGAGANQVRITGGTWRSRLLHFPDVLGLRPTSDRIRGTLFNWLGQDLTGQVCLDLFAGSGALGFEALSRNAKHVVMIERDPKARAALMQSANALGAGSRLEILGTDALQFLLQRNERTKEDNNQRFDVVFCDPPFAQEWFPRLWAPLAGLLAEGGVVYAESEAALTPPASWEVRKNGKAGSVYYHLINIGQETNG